MPNKGRFQTADKPPSNRLTRRLILRPWQVDDEPEFARLCSDPDVMHFISRRRPLSSEEVAEICRRSLKMWTTLGYGPWAVFEKNTGRWIGRAGLNELPDWPGPHKIEVGWELHKRFWGNGFATEVGIEALSFGFEEAALPRIISATRADDLASQRVMEKIGLIRQGVIQLRNADVAWYAADRDDWLARQPLG